MPSRVSLGMNSLRSIIGAVVLTAGTCMASLPDHDLAPQEAVKLINMLIDGHSARIDIAMIVEGSGKSGPFEVKDVRRVVAIHPVQEGGRLIRRMRTYDFLWNETYGWFTWEKREESGGDAIYIWSELKGELVMR